MRYIIRDIIQEFGPQVLLEKRFIYILSDYRAFDRYPVYTRTHKRNILYYLISTGLISRILKHKYWSVDAKSECRQIANATGYSEDCIFEFGKEIVYGTNQVEEIAVGNIITMLKHCHISPEKHNASQELLTIPTTENSSSRNINGATKNTLSQSLRPLNDHNIEIKWLQELDTCPIKVYPNLISTKIYFDDIEIEFKFPSRTRHFCGVFHYRLLDGSNILEEGSVTLNNKSSHYPNKRIIGDFGLDINIISKIKTIHYYLTVINF